MKSTNSLREEIQTPVLAWLVEDIPLEVTELHMITYKQWKKLYARLNKHVALQRKEILEEIEKLEEYPGYGDKHIYLDKDQVKDILRSMG